MPTFRTPALPEKFVSQVHKNVTLTRLENEKGYYAIRAARAEMTAIHAADRSELARRALAMAKRIPVRR